jgi:hypothetical protein
MNSLKRQAHSSGGSWMRRLAPALLFAGALGSSYSSPAQSSEDKDVMAPIQRLFDGIARADRSMMLSALTPEGGSVNSFRQGRLHQYPLHGLVDNAPSEWKPGQYTEKMRDPIVHVDQNIAVVWSPYAFYVDGKPQHCGTDIFNLVKVDEKWLIAAAEDNATENCSGW